MEEKIPNDEKNNKRSERGNFREREDGPIME